VVFHNNALKSFNQFCPEILKDIIMNDTIEINKVLFNEMLFSLLDNAPVEEQVNWLQRYGMVFYDNKMFDSIIQKHSITPEFFDTISRSFWGENEVLYSSYTVNELSEKMGELYYQSYLAFKFNALQSVRDIAISLGNFNENKSLRYYSPMLMKCIITQYNLQGDEVFSFTKVMLPDYTMTIAFKIKTKDGDMFFDICQTPD